MDAENSCCLVWRTFMLSVVGSAFPCIKIGIGCLKLMQRIRHRSPFLPAADLHWQEFWQLGLGV